MIVLYVYINDLNVRGGVVAQLVGPGTYSVQPRSREFRPGRGCVTTLGKLFTPVTLFLNRFLTFFYWQILKIGYNV